jgi:hypothetical protein
MIVNGWNLLQTHYLFTRVLLRERPQRMALSGTRLHSASHWRLSRIFSRTDSFQKNSDLLDHQTSNLQISFFGAVWSKECLGMNFAQWRHWTTTSDGRSRTLNMIRHNIVCAYFQMYIKLLTIIRNINFLRVSAPRRHLKKNRVPNINIPSKNV